MESIIRTWLLDFSPLVIVTMGFFFSMRILRFPDLTLDASFAAGNVGFFLGATSAGIDVVGFIISSVLGALAGFLTGTVYSLHPTGFFKILASVLVMYGFYSINFRLLGDNSAYLPESGRSVVRYLQGIENGFGGHWHPLTYIFSVVVVLIVVFALYVFLRSVLGLKVRTAGWNPGLLVSAGHNVKSYTIIGLMVANSTIAIGGWIDAAIHQRAVINEQGIIIDAIAALLLGELIVDSFSKFKDRRISTEVAIWTPIIGAMVYVLLKILSQDMLESQLKVFIVSDRYALVAAIIFLTVIVARANSKRFFADTSGEAL